MEIDLNPANIDDYRLFLKIKRLPRFAFVGRTAKIPDEYAATIGVKAKTVRTKKYKPIELLFDYQAGIAKLAIAKRKFAAFVRCGMGKTLILGEWLRHVESVMPAGRCALIVSPLMVCRQTIDEFNRFYGTALQVEQVRAKDLPEWITITSKKSRLGITNYEAIRDNLPLSNRLFALGLDESSMLKSHYGKHGLRLIQLGKGLDWKLCLTGTPAPNDRIEYANHAVFLDHFPTVNSFLSRFFVNRGQTDERWELKPHALKPFYRSISHWCIFLSNPAVYGWKDNTDAIPEVRVHIHDVDLTDEQNAAAQSASGALFAMAGGITSRGKLAQIAKGRADGKDIASNKPDYIRDLVNSWYDSTIVWCRYNAEQDAIAAQFPGCANIDGRTPDDERLDLIDQFQSGKRKVLVSKPAILGFGLNLQICKRMVFSTCQDSYEEYAQAVARANRYGSTTPLDVHIPITEIERPMLDTVLRKAKMIEHDTAEQESIFKEFAQCL